MKKLVILGAGGFARETQQLIKDINQRYLLNIVRVLGFIDENIQNKGKIIHGVSVLGDFKWLETADRSIGLVLGVGSPWVKKKFVEKATALGLKFRHLSIPARW